MDTVEEIKRAIQTLTDEQRRELEAWWHPAYDEWDLQMDSDAKAGKLDPLSEQALKDFRTGNCDEFPWRVFDLPISESSSKTCLKKSKVSPQKNINFGNRIPATPLFISNLLVSENPARVQSLMRTYGRNIYLVLDWYPQWLQQDCIGYVQKVWAFQIQKNVCEVASSKTTFEGMEVFNSVPSLNYAHFCSVHSIPKTWEK